MDVPGINLTDPDGRASGSRLVARAREQAWLRAVLARARLGQGRLVLVGGEAGIGKTSLVRDLVDEVAGQGVLVLAGYCYDLSNTPPYGPWLDMFDRYIPGPAGPPAPSALASGTLLRIGDRGVLFVEVRRFLASLGAAGPVCVVLEDLHWADVASLELLRNVASQVARWPVVLLATYRSDELTVQRPLFQQLPALVHEGEALRIDLRRLDRAGMRALVAGQVRLRPEDAERLTWYLDRHAEGNPFFATELIRALEGDILVAGPEGDWALGRLDRVVLPTLLRQVIDLRLARLTHRTRQSLALAAVIGQRVPLDSWARIAELSEEKLLEVVDEGVQAHLIDADRDGAHVHFRHAVTREALYEGILPPRRRFWNLRAAGILLEQADPDPDAVAFHLEQAGDERAWEWLVKAADRAHRAYAWLTAADRLRAAASLLDGVAGHGSTRRTLFYRMGHMLRFSYPAEAQAALAAAVELPGTGPDPAFEAEARFLHGFFACYLDRFRAGLEEMTDARRAQRALPGGTLLEQERTYGLLGIWGARPRTEWSSAGEAQVRALRAVGLTALDCTSTWHLASTGRSEEAASWSDRLLDVLGRRTESGGSLPAIAGFSLHALAIAWVAAGRPAEAAEAWRRSRMLLTGVDHFMVVAFTLLHEACDLAATYGAADPAMRRSLAAAAEDALVRAGGALRPGVSPRLAWLGTLVLDGRWDEADGILRDLPPTGNAYLRREVTAATVTLARHRGQSEVALEEIGTVLEDGPATVPGDDIHQEALELQRVAAELAIDEGDLPRAREWLEANDRWLAWNGAVLGRAAGRLGWARWHRATGDLDTARAIADEALSLATDPPQPLVRLAAHRLLGEIGTASGRFAAAQVHLRTALDLALACEVPLEHALTLLALAESHTAADAEATSVATEMVRKMATVLRAGPLLRRVAALEARRAVSTGERSAPAGLTPRELEVLRLLTRRLSNAEIAVALLVGQRTVQTHVEHILGKLGVANRREAAEVAIRLGIV